MVVRPIDRFISALHRENAEELVLETGRTGRVRSNGQERVILAQEVRSEQIELLLRDVLPAELRDRYQLDGELAFPYRAPTGPVAVRVRRVGERVGVSIRSYPSSAANHPAPGSAAAPPVSSGAASAAEASGKSIPSRPTVPAAPVLAVPGFMGNGHEERPLELARPVRHSAGVHHVSGVVLAGRYDAIARPLVVSAPNAVLTVATSAPDHDTDAAAISLDLSTTSLPVLTSVDLRPVPTGDVTPAVVGVPARTFERKDRAEILAKSKNKIDPILAALLDAGGSDLHMTSGLAPRLRKDGEMDGVPGFSDPLDSEVIESWLMEIAPSKSRARFEATSDADYAYEIPGAARFRVNAFRDRRGAGGVIRVIPSEVLTADQLRFPQALRDLCTLDRGLVLVTGSTGSGKSTTLAGMIDLINKTRRDHIVTIEDPVEFVHQPQLCLINQREVHADTESFATGLRAALREDPDVILVGEMRDLETVAMAIESAETGHLVFGTLHTNTAVSTVDRIVDQFPTDRQAQVRVMLSASLRGVIAQNLCRKVGGGRVAALEILLVLPAVANLIREGKTFQIPSIMQTSKVMGMQTLNDALATLVAQGLVSVEEAMRCSPARTELRAVLERSGAGRAPAANA